MSELKPCQDLDLKPCPMCGESLIKHSDHHGEWYAHRLEPGPCILSFMQIFDQKDAAAWNTRVSPDLTARIEAAAEEIATKADEGWPALRCDKCGSLELIRNVPEYGYDCRGCSNFTRTPDEVIGITKIDLEKLATAIIRRHLEVK